MKITYDPNREVLSLRTETADDQFNLGKIAGRMKLEVYGIANDQRSVNIESTLLVRVLSGDFK
jgi:hypothetical protein